MTQQSHSGRLPRNTESIGISKPYLHTRVHSTGVYSRQKLKSTQVSVDKGKMSAVCPSTRWSAIQG